ncbi:MAG: hypothetical protein R6U10_06835 [Thermoplasmatota archaeon]
MAIHVLGVDIPLWLLFLLIILALFIGWKLLKFAVTLLIVLVLIFVILMVGDLVWPYLSSWL